jgi:hypothetical protein
MQHNPKRVARAGAKDLDSSATDGGTVIFGVVGDDAIKAWILHVGDQRGGGVVVFLLEERTRELPRHTSIGIGSHLNVQFTGITEFQTVDS